MISDDVGDGDDDDDGCGDIGIYSRLRISLMYVSWMLDVLDTFRPSNKNWI